MKRLLSPGVLVLVFAAAFVFAVAGGGARELAAQVDPASDVQDPQDVACPMAGNPATEAGWIAYRAGDYTAAGIEFASALERCPVHLGARVGTAYVALQQGRLDDAAPGFEAVIEDAPEDVDAWIGLGLIAWRRADLEEVASRFARVAELDPGNATAEDYLGRLPEGLGPPPDRPSLILPDTIVVSARTNRDRFQVPGEEGWEDFWVKGMNLGAALPGRNPSEFPDREVYDEWIEQMARMNVNTIRVYTIHPPAFYDALAEYNRTHPEAPLWLIHGVWTELPPDDDFLGEAFEGEFFGEMRRIVDLLHGRADIRPRPGHASGFYTTDVSRWTLAYIIGREWEPHSTVAFDSIHPELDRYDGRYVRVEGGNAMDAWLGRAVDTLVAYETERYRNQRPVAWTNWPTLDPLEHPTESTREEEIALRLARGERVDLEPREYDNDAIGVDPSLLRPTDAFPAGTFASYHAYPYYPDFLILSDRYRDAASSLGPSNYFGYLEELKAHHDDMPLLIAEYGVPTSHGPAHLQPQGWHHGGHTEAEMAEINRRLTLEIAEAGGAGAILFAWIDEWFKRNWLVTEFELPYERNRFWNNRLDAEQQYGMVAVETEPPLAGVTLDERIGEWRAIPALSESGDLTVRAAADAAYLWLLVETPGRAVGDQVFVGLDTVEPELGEFRWPGGVGSPLPVGVEFSVVDDGTEARVLAHPPQNPFRLVPVGREGTGPEAEDVPVENPPPNLFRGRLEQRMNVPFVSLESSDGVYDTLRVIPNRRRIGRDGREYAAIGYERGLLREGEPPDGLVSRAPGLLELRIPWLLVNVTDPSSRSVLWTPGGQPEGFERTPEGRVPDPVGGPVPSDTLSNAFGSRTIQDIGVLASLARSNGSWTDAWEGRTSEAVSRFGWSTWETPEWVVRERPTFSVMAETFGSLDPWTRDDATGNATAVPDPGPTAGPDRVPAALADGFGPERVRTDLPASAFMGSGTRGRFEASQDSVRAEADRAWAEGRPMDAEPLYREVLEGSPDDERALHRIALASAWDGRTSEALELLDRLVALAPGNVEARVDRARFLAWEGRLDQSLVVLDSLSDIYPDHAGILQERARIQAWAGRFDESLEGYEDLLDITPGDRSVRRARAQTLTWAEDFEQATAAYREILAEDPEDLDTRLDLARALSFANRLDEAEAEYDSVLARHPGDVRALQGKGRVLAWAGNLIDAESVLRNARELSPEEVEVRISLAQVLRWQGRHAAALGEIRVAEELAPGRGDVLEQREWIEVALAPSARSSLAFEGDSDENRMLTLSLGASATATPRVTVRGDAYRRNLEQDGLAAREATGGRLTGSVQLEPGWTVSLGAGVSRNDGPETRSINTATASLASPGRYPVTGSVTWSRQALDVTAALARQGVRTDGVEVDLGWAFAARWTLRGGGGWTVFRGSEDNERRHLSAAVHRQIDGGWTVGLSGRTFAFEKDLADGYFDPDRYRLVETTARWTIEPRPWGLVLEGAPGMQRIRSADPAATLRASARLTYRRRPGQEMYLGAGGSSAGLQSFASEEDYRYFALLAGVSWVF